MSGPQQITLSDGRNLDVWVSGPDGGTPLIFHHGTPSSGVPMRALERAAAAQGLRLVTASRPGYGGSSRHAGRRVVDVVADTAEVLKSLNAEECFVLGWSGGGPHSLACAARLPQATRAGIIAGVAPYQTDDLDWMADMGEDNVEEFSATLAGEATLRPWLEERGEDHKSVTVEDLVPAMESLLPEVDRAVLTDEFGEDLAASMREGLKLGIDGWLDDDLAFVQPWGFELSEISVPLSIWQGSADLMVPFAHGQWLARTLPHATAHLESGEGHLSIGVGAIQRLVDELVGR
jgi:pimeloyl-ACP methyl ester carboxylesterase